MSISPFHAYYKSRELSGLSFGKDRLLAAYASSDMEVYPYQIAAALFALRSPYLRGAVLCDEGSLGKTFEAMLVMVQSWHEGRDKILVVTPTPLLAQWADILERHFSLPYHVADIGKAWEDAVRDGRENLFDADGIVLASYSFAMGKADAIAGVPWDLVVFEEAHHLGRIAAGRTEGATILRRAFEKPFKLLLTATPLRNSILDLHELVQFIDDRVFGNADEFHRRYFRQPEKYPELASRAGKYCFRTTRKQVENYVGIPRRLAATAEYELTKPEKRLYSLLERYLELPAKHAFPAMQRYDLTLMLCRAFSSSTFAFRAILAGMESRVAKLAVAGHTPAARDELLLIRDMLGLADTITDNAKGKELLKALKDGFGRLRKLGAAGKAIIFTENRATQDYLSRLLATNGYDGKIVVYNGDTSRDYARLIRFRDDADILLATDAASEGFNLEFCSFVVNYDLPYAVLTLEQRINRCHRQGQKSDVLVLNFLNRHNFADVRMLELVNKRIRQFDGILGLSDSVLGEFGKNTAEGLGRILDAARPAAAITHEFDETLRRHAETNREEVAAAEESLFTSFTSEIADAVQVTPRYIGERVRALNDDLWLVTRHFFEKWRDIRIDDATRTISCTGMPPKVFTGARMGRSEYSMAPDYRPRSGRHTLAGPLARAILTEMYWVGIPERGTITVSAEIVPCRIGYYEVEVKPEGHYLPGRRYNVFVGRTADGRVLDDAECRAVMELPVAGFTLDGATIGARDAATRRRSADKLDCLVDADALVRKTLDDAEFGVGEEVAARTAEYRRRAAALEREVDRLNLEVARLEKDTEGAVGNLERLQLKKKANAARLSLKRKRDTLFLEKMRLERELEERLRRIRDDARLTATITRQFTVSIEAKGS